MTDKIMIDGVDVSGCKNIISNYEIHHNIDGSITHHHACECGVCGVENYHLECKYNDCYYKQLQAEQRKVKELKDKFKRFFNIDNQECWDLAFMNDEKEKYKQALEEIKEIVKKEIVCDECNFQGTDKCDSRLCTSFYLDDFCKGLLQKCEVLDD